MFYNSPPLLLADIGEVLTSLLGVAALVMWVIKQIVEANKQAAPRGPRPAAPPRPQQAAKGGMPPAGQAGQQADPLRNQVEEFLRRAGRGPQGGNQPGQPERPPRPATAPGIEMLVDDSAAQQRRPLAEPLRPVEARQESIRPPSAQPPTVAKGDKPRRGHRSVVRRGRESVSERAAERIAGHAQSLAEQSSSLGKRIIEEDQQFDVQLKAKFDHTVGTLTGSGVAAAEQAAAAAATAASPASQIAAMLATPDGVRQAMIVNEILRRPSDRW